MAVPEDVTKAVREQSEIKITAFDQDQYDELITQVTLNQYEFDIVGFEQKSLKLLNNRYGMYYLGNKY